MGRYLTPQDFIAQFGEDEARQIAGNGAFNSLEGAQVDAAQIEAEIAFADELIDGYVLAKNPWVSGRAVADMPKLLKGLGGDIVRYRLRDKGAGKGQVSETVEKRYGAALKSLRDIQEGRLNLTRQETDGAPTPAPSTDSAGISGPGLQSGRILEGYL